MKNCNFKETEFLEAQQYKNNLELMCSMPMRKEDGILTTFEHYEINNYEAVRRRVKPNTFLEIIAEGDEPYLDVSGAVREYMEALAWKMHNKSTPFQVDFLCSYLKVSNPGEPYAGFVMFHSDLKKLNKLDKLCGSIISKKHWYDVRPLNGDYVDPVFLEFVEENVHLVRITGVPLNDQKGGE